MMRKAEAKPKAPKAKAKAITSSAPPPPPAAPPEAPTTNAKLADCCACTATVLCVPVVVERGRWFWFCAECSRRTTSAWAEAYRDARAAAP